MTGKIEALHLLRRACLYVRQSSMTQVLENTESTARQYALVERACALGWARDKVEVIDEDLGKSGATSTGRSGFARLAESVARGEVGAVLAIEVSRLARCSLDWQRLLALCAVARVVVIDEHAVYDPRSCDDKMLLDFKGTMSEAELHWLALRMTGARRSKASRGELRFGTATGYVWADHGVELDLDETVRHAIRMVFDRFAIEPSAGAVVRWAHDSGFRVPTRRSFADGTTEVVWKPLALSRLNDILHNPIYAGAYVYGRRQEQTVLVAGEIKSVRHLNRPDQWPVRIEGAHQGYITWQAYLDNIHKLRENAPQAGLGGAAREGPALLCGLLLCGRCGRRMRTIYWGKHDDRWSYSCMGEKDKGERMCWSLTGSAIDAAVEALFLRTMAPAELDVCLAVEQRVQAQAASLNQQWQLHLEKAEYEARRAERRYKAVDPDNRVVARTLEHEWETRLRELAEVKRRYELAQAEHRVTLSDNDREQILALARDLPAVWRAPTTTPADRKAMLRLAIEAVAVSPIDDPTRQTRIRVQWQSGTVSELTVDRPGRGDLRRPTPHTVTRIRELAVQGLRDEDIAERLLREGVPTATGGVWTEAAVKWMRRKYDIPRITPDLPRRALLPDRQPDGRYSIQGAARRFGVSEIVVRRWIQCGLVTAAREDFAQHRGVWWLSIDEHTTMQIENEAARSRQRSLYQTTRLEDGGPAV